MPVVERIWPKHIREAKPAPSRHTKRTVGICVLGVLIISLLTYAALTYVHQTNQPLALVASPIAQPSATAVTVTPSPQPVAYAALDGRTVPEGKQNLRPLAVMIENHPDARPQYGLGQANLVYEAIAEGGITRFMAVFDDAAGTNARVGPVRSARTYYLHFADELNAIYAHAGGNADALDQINAGAPIFNVDGLAVGSPVFTRDYSRKVASEHTLYSTTGAIWNYAASKGASTAGSFSGWQFQDDAALDQRPASQTAVVNVSTSEFNVTWTYDRTTNTYLRTMAGTPHVDAGTGKQISTKNIVLQQVARQATVTRIGEEGWIYTTTGSGPATIIQNGQKIVGTWRNDGSRTKYYDAAGAEIKFVRGTTWVHLVHTDSAITVS